MTKEIIDPASPIIAFKGFDKNMQCRGLQYEVGKTYEHKGEVKACNQGFHVCENPFDVWTYYPPTDGNKFAEVAIAGAVDRHGEDSKIAAASLTVSAALTFPQFVGKAISWLIGHCGKDTESKAAQSGSYSKAAQSGASSKAAQSGASSKAAQSGYKSTAAQSGDSSTAAQSGASSTAAQSGASSTAAQSGSYSTAAQSGSYSKAASIGANSVAASIGHDCQAAAGPDGWIVLAYWRDGKPVHVKAAKTGGPEGVKPNRFYALDKDGHFVDCGEVPADFCSL